VGGIYATLHFAQMVYLESIGYRPDIYLVGVSVYQPARISGNAELGIASYLYTALPYPAWSFISTILYDKWNGKTVTTIVGQKIEKDCRIVYGRLHRL